MTSPPTCGHIVEGEVIVPCGQPATSWRWYQDVEHEDCLLPACEEHANEGGRRMARLTAERDALLAKDAHTCHDKCPRMACVLRREITHLETELSHYKATNQNANELAEELRREVNAWEKQFPGGLGQAQQGWHMAVAAVEAIGTAFEHTSPNDIIRAVAKLRADRDSLRSRLGEAKKALTEIRDHNASPDEFRNYGRQFYHWMKIRAATFLAGEEANG